MARCPRCGGGGGVLLLFSVVDCNLCVVAQRNMQLRSTGTPARRVPGPKAVRYVAFRGDDLPFGGLGPPSAICQDVNPIDEEEDGYHTSCVRELNEVADSRDDHRWVSLDRWCGRAANTENWHIADMGPDRGNWVD